MSQINADDNVAKVLIPGDFHELNFQPTRLLLSLETLCTSFQNVILLSNDIFCEYNISA